MEIPNFVFKHGGQECDWIEQHDVCKTDVLDKVRETTEEKWWLTNWKIRRALKSIAIQCESRITRDLNVSNRLVSIVSIAKEAGVSRLTVLHKERLYWVELSRLALLERITKPLNNGFKRQLKDLKSKSKELSRRLYMQREETTRQLIRNQELEEENRRLNKIIANYERKNAGNDINSRSLRID
jgi:hypothetical protein